MTPGQEEAFTEFATSRFGALRRTAYLLCGDWHGAEDLVQITLGKMYAKWHRIRDPAAGPAYARQVLVRTYVDQTRRRGHGEIPMGEVPDRAALGVDSDRRLALLAALGKVTPAYRAVLVLRFWEDQSVEQTAELLGKSSAAVRSATTRGLEQLRGILGPTLVDLALA